MNHFEADDQEEPRAEFKLCNSAKTLVEKLNQFESTLRRYFILRVKEF